MSDEQCSGVYQHDSQILKKIPFHLIAKPSGARCNLDCEYCFYLSKSKLYDTPLSAHRMSDATLKLFIRQYIQRQPKGTREVNFVWQGGEPTLLGLDFYKKVVDYQQHYCLPGMSISNSFQTNGLLINDEWSKFFKANQFLVGISIDGTERLHDKYRKKRNGKGSFKSVMEAIESFNKYKVDFNTMTVVQNDNGSYPNEIYNFMKSIGSHFMQFIPIVEPDAFQNSQRGQSPSSSKGEATYRSVKPKQWGEFLVEIFNQWIQNDIGEYFITYFENFLALVCGYSASICTLQPYCGKAMVIEHNGDIYSCDHYVFEDTKIGNIYKKDLGLIVNEKEQIQFGMDKYLRLPNRCKECRWFSLCFGGCPANRLIELAGEPKKNRLNYLCEGYTYFFEKTINRLEAMALAIKDHQLAQQYKDYL